uniref:Myb-like domain-containing protein n=1 Tax=Leersia perrieri TaxID=77586 RepID=A0A0D9VB45_9ORYZ
MQSGYGGHHHQNKQQHQPPPPARWAPQQHHHHHLGLDVEAAVPESSGAGAGSAASGAAAPPGVPPFLAAAMRFKLDVDGGGGSGATGGTDDALNDGGGAGSGMMLHGGGGGGGDDEAATESRLRRWPGEEEARPLDIDYIHSASSSKRTGGKDKAPTPESPAPPAPANYFKNKPDDNAAAAAASSGAVNYKLFSELEAIYKPGSGGAQTGSGSGLTGDDNAMLAPPMADLPAAAAATGPPLNTSETSAGEDAAAVMQPAPRLMEHQESLHRQFLDTMERRERDRAARDEAWRRQEADKFSREAAARAADRASAAAREAAIISYLEKISGETITLPVAPPVPPPAAAGDDVMMTSSQDVGKELVSYDGGEGMHHLSSSRWPKHEVEALIRVRTGLEERFQEPGLKGPLWEEVSARMAAAGYRRNSKRCKEKWENINKYFRKAKESGKKRPAHAKTCPYFDELDRLYSRSKNAAGDDSGSKGSELLDAVVKNPEVRCGRPPGFPFDDEGGNEEGRKAEEDGDVAAGHDDGDGEKDGVGTSVTGRATDQAEEDDEMDESHHDDH